jgi:uncharacterized membrane protein YgcG
MKKTLLNSIALPRAGRTALLLGRVSLIAMATALVPLTIHKGSSLPQVAAAFAQTTDDGTADQGSGDALGGLGDDLNDDTGDDNGGNDVGDDNGGNDVGDDNGGDNSGHGESGDSGGTGGGDSGHSGGEGGDSGGGGGSGGDGGGDD